MEDFLLVVCNWGPLCKSLGLCFQYIHENFTNAPSNDLSPVTLDMLVHLMCAQARECLFEKAELGVAAAADCSSPEVVEECLSVGQEASHVSDVYGKVHAIMADEGQEDYVPFSWVALAQVKKEHYRYKTLLLQNPLEI